MIPLSAQTLAELVGGTVRGQSERVFTALFSDSRQPVAGALFVALSGERFDGHAFVSAVRAAGAGGALVRRGASADELIDGFTLIEVDDTQAALEALGAALRERHPGVFIAITGSVGKTTVKDMVAAMLTAFGKVGKTPGNLNNNIGLPLTLARLDGDEAFVVLELGMSAPGEIAHLTRIARPDVGVVTRADAAHLEFFRDVDAIADAKAELYAGLRRSAIAIVNADDPRLSQRALSLRGSNPIVTFGRREGATVQVMGADHTSDGLVASLAVDADSFRGQPASGHRSRLDVTVATLGLHNADNVAAAIAVCRALDLEVRRAAEALSAVFRPAKHRLQVLRLGALTVLDDSYNANPASTRAALAAFGALAFTPGERLAVIGSMRELGPDADLLHAAIGAEAAAIASVIATTGPHAEALAQSARESGATVLAAPDVAALIPAIVRWTEAHPSGALLLKGSRGERLERVLDHLPAASQGGR